MDPLLALDRAVYLLDRELAPSSKVRAFRRAAEVIAALPAEELHARVAAGTLTDLDGIGPSTAEVVADALHDVHDGYLARLEERTAIRVRGGHAVREALRGDCHLHTSWSDGAVPVRRMVDTAMALGHEYLVVTDHSPRLAIARGLTADRLRRQLDVIAGINAGLPAGFRILSGIEVDILTDGGLDQDPDLLARLDVVVGSVHSGLNADSTVMTARMLAAITDPNLDILGHCTGRRLSTRDANAQAGGSDRAHRSGAARAESAFDAAAVFAACAEHDKAVEINCRPDRLDPPKRLLRQAIEAGCRFTIDTDAHAPGQLDWLAYGCERAARCGLPAELVVNAWPAKRLLDWAARH